MKKTFVILSAAAMTLIAGCQKENFGSMDSNRTVLSVGINEAKTTLGELDGTKRPIYWANGDVLRANDLTSNALSGLPEKCKSASFTFEGTLTYPANLLYPAAYYKDAQTITLPELQAKTTNVPLYGYAESDAGVQMNALLALIRIPVKQGEDKDALKSIVVESKTDGYSLSGDFTIDYQTGALTPGAGASAKTGMNFTTQLNPDTAVDFFIAVPAGEGVSLSVKFKDQMGHCMTKTLSNKTFVAGQISALPEIVFAPTTTEFDVVITTAAELVKFAQDYNSGLYDEPYVQLANDIVFDEQTSADFVATGGIGVQGDETAGTSDNYFNGLFDGGNHSIKSYVSYTGSGADMKSAPIFAYTGNGSYIANIILDKSCSFTFPKGYAAPLVGRMKGILKNCVNNADVNLSMVAGATYFGGLIGRVYGGTVEYCTMNGQLLNGTTNSSTRVYDVGGIAATLEDGGTVKNCDMNNIIIWGQKSAASGPKLVNGTLYMGHVVGNVIKGNVENCNVTSTNDTSSDIRGNATGYVGGVAGILQNGSIKECTCSRYIYVRFSAGDYLYAGGIVGSNSGEVTGCSNTKKFTPNGGEVIVISGGICGLNNENAEIIDCNNSGDLAAPSQYTSTTTYYAGGIVGKNDGTVAGTETFTNSGAVGGSNAKLAATVAYVGGIAGSTSKSISNCTNSGAVTLGRGDDATGKNIQCISGAIGFIETDGVAIENVTNTGAVTYSATSKLNGRISRLGGIVGCISAGNVSVLNCTNEGKLANNNFNNKYTLAGGAITGGIVGVVIGKDNENKVLISNCVNQKGTHQGQRGILGGIVGYIDYGEVNGCRNTQNTGAIDNNITAYTGGVAGWAVNSLLKSSDVISDINQKATVAGNVGGVVSKLDANSTVDGCTYHGKITCQAPDDGSATVGGVANVSTATSTIQNCKFKGTYSIDGGANYSEFKIENICRDTNFIDGGGNAIME